ncbi:MAG: BrnT family toxin [Victivallales bacterium]
MKFEWDAKKADKNRQKHSVVFTEAATVFGDPLSETFPDPDHSFGEFRYLTIGQSMAGRLLVIGHTDRGDTIRIITARQATTQERHYYENKRD